VEEEEGWRVEVVEVRAVLVQGWVEGLWLGRSVLVPLTGRCVAVEDTVWAWLA
jgi:hypothetical protein